MRILSGCFLLSFSGLIIHIFASGIDPFPVPYSSSFREPAPPQLPTDFTANFMQQKYDATGINHIVAGFAFYSLQHQKIRLDGADGSLFSSLFDFGNTSTRGVSNRMLSFNGGIKLANTSCFSDFVVPGEMLFTADMLKTTQAVFTGIQMDSLYGPLNTWQFLAPNVPSIPVTAFLDANNTLVRFDFAAPGEPARTFTTTRFFNIVLGPVNPVVFETDCR